MEILTSQGLLISPNVALPVTGQNEDSSNHSSEESSPQSDISGNTPGSVSSSGSLTSMSTDKRKDKWNKSNLNNLSL